MTIQRVVTQQVPRTHTEPQRSPGRASSPVRGWLAIAAGLVAAVVLVVLTVTSGSTPQQIDRPPAQPDSGLAGVPRSADGAERYLSQHQGTRPMGVPGSADAAERYLSDQK